jgi:LmbE family N-acetylglucosaminyl deacetylase
MNILAIGAHPDDIEYGCGGILSKFVGEKKNKIYFFVATEGEFGGKAGARIKEQEKAAKTLGVEKIFWGNFTDTRLVVGRELIGSIETAIKESNPDIILVNYIEDSHQDHRALAESTVVAARYSKKVLFYEDFTSNNFEPDIFVDIEPVIKKKERILRCHESQIEREYPSGLDIMESVRAVANFRGFQAKVKYAEGFRALRYLLEDF